MLLQELHLLCEAKTASKIIQPGVFMLWTDTADFSSKRYISPQKKFGSKVKQIAFNKSKMQAERASVLELCKKYDSEFDESYLDEEIDILSNKTVSGGHYEIYDVSALTAEEITLMKREFHKARRGGGYPDDPDNWSSALINLPKGLTVDSLAKLCVRRWGNPSEDKWFKSSHSF